MKILVTGAAGFIGSKVCQLLAERGDEVVGIDNINTYYDPNLKYARLQENGLFLPETVSYSSAVPEAGNDGAEATFPDLTFGTELVSVKYTNLRFIRMDIADRTALPDLFKQEKFDKVVNLAAQAGVRYSLKNPFAYIESNVMGFMNILECSRLHNIQHLVYASSSSVYGMNDKVPYSEDDEVKTPVSIYAATKKSNELMAHAYGKLYNLPSTGLRYFTVYGPWGRPDMAPMIFANAISSGKAINVFNNGDLIRDFTYIDDIASGTIQTLDHIPSEDSCPNRVPVKVYNIGCSNPVKLMDFIHEIEKNLGIDSKKNYMPMQKGDVYQTNADTSHLEQEINYKPIVKLEQGIAQFIKWYKSFVSN